MNRHLCTKRKPYCNCDPTKCRYYSAWKQQLWALNLPERESFFLDHTDKEELTQEKWLATMQNDLICPYFRREQPHFDGDLSKIEGKRFRWAGMRASAILLAILLGMSLSVLWIAVLSVVLPEEAVTFLTEAPFAPLFFIGISLILLHTLLFFLLLYLLNRLLSFRTVAVTNEYGLYLPCGVFPWDEITAIDYQIGMRHSRYNRDPNTVALKGKDFRIILMNLPKSLLKEARAHKPSLTLTVVKASGKRKPF